MPPGNRSQTRLTDALLRTLGGRTVLLRMPAPAVPGDDTEQLGAATPLFNPVALGPAVLRKTFTEAGDNAAVTAELLVSASAVERIVGSLAFDSAAVLFHTVAGIAIDDQLYEVTSMTTAEAFGSVYLYRVGLSRQQQS